MPPLQRRRRRHLLVACCVLCGGRRSQLATSFHLPAPTRRPSPSRWTLRSGAPAAADDDHDGGSQGRTLNDNAILGETLDVNLRDGTYSWSNPNAVREDIRSPLNSASSASKNRYKRIEFDGCGSILLHQEPKAFVEPNASSKESGNDASDRRRQKGRTGVTLWSASYVISYYIDAQWSKDGAWHCKDVEGKPRSRQTVLELGAGLGLCSAVAAKHGMNVVSTDNDPDVLKLLAENLGRNQNIGFGAPTTEESNVPSNETQQQVHVHSLDWIAAASDPETDRSHPVFQQLESLGGADFVVLSDVVYGATRPSWEDLLMLLNKFRAQRYRHRLGSGCEGNGNAADTIVDPIVLLGYTQRRRDMSPQDEACFFAMAQDAGMEAELVPTTCIPNGEKYMLTSLFELRWIG